MSLGMNTKCDLDAEVAKIDLTALGNVLQTAYFKAIIELKDLAEMPQIGVPANYTNSLASMVSHQHQTMTRHVVYLGQLAELARTVDQAANREVKIVNRSLGEVEKH